MRSVRRIAHGYYSRVDSPPDPDRRVAIVEGRTDDGFIITVACYEDDIESMHDELMSLQGMFCVVTRGILGEDGSVRAGSQS